MIPNIVPTLLAQLQQKSITSPFLPYADTGILTKEEHDAMHSTRLNSDSSFPHTNLLIPVYKTPNDPDSKLVAYVGGGFAWDFALRQLLPDNVGGIVVEIQNSCNESSLYELDGYDAFYLGENATRETKYDNMKVARDLTFTNPDYILIPGDCTYSIVST